MAISIQSHPVACRLQFANFCREFTGTNPTQVAAVAFSTKSEIAQPPRDRRRKQHARAEGDRFEVMPDIKKMRSLGAGSRRYLRQ